MYQIYLHKICIASAARRPIEGGAAVYHITWKQADNDWTAGLAPDGKIAFVGLND
jgi:hypothetical protein